MSWLAPDESEQAEFERLVAATEDGDLLLLRNARLRHVPESDAGLESRLWFDPRLATRGERDVVLHPGLARLLAARLRGLLDADGWRAHSAHWDPVERLELELRLAMVEGREHALRHGLQRVLAELQRRTRAPPRTRAAR